MLAKTKPLKSKICKVCKGEFHPDRSLQVTCGYKCAAEHGKKKVKQEQAKKVRDYKAITRRKKKQIKTRAKWLAEAQTACNAYIRKRDEDKGCISCGTQKLDIQYCAGHYKTRGGSPALRFHPMNIHKQCNHRCNLHLSGNIQEYKTRLIEKIGFKNVQWLETNNSTYKLTIDDIKEIKAYYKEQLKLIKTSYDRWIEPIEEVFLK